MFYIGAEGPTLSSLLLNYSRCQVISGEIRLHQCESFNTQFHSYNPVTMVSRKEGLNVNKALGKRSVSFIVCVGQDCAVVSFSKGIS